MWSKSKGIPAITALDQCEALLTSGVPEGRELRRKEIKLQASECIQKQTLLHVHS